jgi:outer membrane protein assembly factor BamB
MPCWAASAGNGGPAAMRDEDTMHRAPHATRRAALRGLLGLSSLAGLSGCGLWDEWFGENKPPLPGKREPVLAARRGMKVDEGGDKRIILPPPVRNAAWPQTGGNPAHLMGHLAANEVLDRAWSSSIGKGGGYRRKILAQPVSADGVLYTMDSDAVITAFNLETGSRLWRTDTRNEDADSTNVGGGMAVDGGLIYAVNGLAELVALDAKTGVQKYRQGFAAPARSAPTVAEGRIFFSCIDDKLLAMATEDGRQLWAYQGRTSQTALLGQPAPGYADGIVVAGFGSGDLVALRAESGSAAWSDSLGAVRGRTSVADLSAIRGQPVIANGRVFVMGVGGQTVGLDVRSGRRLWEREVGGTESPWVAGDWLFIVSSDQQIAAINALDGRIAWVTDLPRWANEEKSKDPIYWVGPLLAGDRLIVASSGGDPEILAVSPYTGQILGRKPLPGDASLAPILVSGTLLQVTDDGSVVAFR